MRKRKRQSLRTAPAPRRLSKVSLVALVAFVTAVAGSIIYFTQRQTPAKHYERGLQLSRQGQGATATAEWREAIRLDHKYALPYIAIATQAESAGDIGSAIRSLEVLRSYNTSAPDVLGHLAQLYGLANRFEKSLVTARAAIQADPNDATAHNTLGMLLDLADDHAGAAMELGQAHRLSPDDEALALDYARVLALAGHAEQAFAIVEQDEHNAHATYATQADYLYGWLLAEYGKNGKPDAQEALHYLENVLKYEPDHIATNTEIGQIYLRQGKFDVALPYLEHAVKLGPSSTLATHALAEAFEGLGRAEMIEAFQLASRADQATLPLRRARNRYLSRPTDMDNLLILAELESNSGNPGDALDLANQVLLKTPDLPNALALRKRLTSTTAK